MPLQVFELRDCLQMIMDMDTLSSDEVINRFTEMYDDELVLGDTDFEELFDTFIDMLINENEFLVSQPVISYIIKQGIFKLPNVHMMKCASKIILAYVRQIKIHSFKVLADEARQMLSWCYKRKKNYSKAADRLIEIDIDSMCDTDDYKFKMCIKIAALCLKYGDTSTAKRYIIKSSNYPTPEDEMLNIKVKKLRTRLLDYDYKFVEAALQFYELSTITILPQAKCMTFFKNSFECALLSSLGPPRLQVLSLLYKDCRSKELAEFPILSKMYFNHIINTRDILEIYAILNPFHQNAKTIDGETIFNQAMLEHNIFGISKLYKNIYIDSLGHKLGVEAITAQRLVAKMLSEDHIQGSIDQEKNLIIFRNSIP